VEISKIDPKIALQGLLTASARAKNRAHDLAAVTKRHEFTVKQLLQAYDPSECVVYRTFLVPTELMYATGTLPFTPEMACAVYSRDQNLIEHAVQNAEEAGHSLKQCSFLKTIVGCTESRLLPQPSIVVGSPCFCDGIGAVLAEVADSLQVPFFYLDLPLKADEDAIDYVAKRLRALACALCEISGASLQDVERERLPRALATSSAAGREWRAIERLRQQVPSPMSGRAAIDFATGLTQTWGSPEILQIYRLLRAELEDRVRNKIAAVPGESARLLWLHLRPYYDNKIMNWIEKEGVAVVFEEVNAPSRGKMDEERPFHSLARDVLQNFGRFRRFTPNWADDLRYWVKEFKIDGAIHFHHDNCAWAEVVLPPEHRLLRDELRVPFFSLDGDCLIKGRDRLLQTRTQDFLENLLERKKPPVPSRFGRKAAMKSLDGRCFVGVDVGSTCTKVVVIGEDSEILGSHTMPTGRNNRTSVETAVKTTLNGIDTRFEHSIAAVVATGVGRGNVSVNHEDVTEITCHTRGVTHLVPETESIIDIGGQDTKAILVREAVCRMNNSCAAGTGKFLEAIAAALGLQLEDLAKLDGHATQAEPISKMCTVFAESEVVNRIAAGAEPAQVIRGVHEMVASKAATLLRQLSRNIASPVVFSGGVAKNLGVVRALERSIDCEITVPQNPQLMGALGAALIAKERWVSGETSRSPVVGPSAARGGVSTQSWDVA
jgi:predicted CoA-substrate-specific enzyme activase